MQNGNPYVQEDMQRMQMQNQCEQMPRANYSIDAHRGNDGFGANNLENLE